VSSLRFLGSDIAVPAAAGLCGGAPRLQLLLYKGSLQGVLTTGEGHKRAQR
jgi:hypothetical protein